MDGLATITRSRWFERMWVTLEYLRSNKVLIIGEDFVVFNVAAADFIARLDDCVSDYEALPHPKDRLLCTGKGQWIWDMKVSWTDMEEWKALQPGNRTLGSAVFIMGLKQCRDFDDYFLALDAMLSSDKHSGQSQLSDTRFERFHALALQALERGDYTPLLFTPVNAETPDPRAPWLRGYSRMSPLFWDLGLCRLRACSQQIIRDGCIRAELEFVGTVKHWEVFEVPGHLHDYEVFSNVASRILDASGVCPKALCTAVDRVFPSGHLKGVGSAERPARGDAAPRSLHGIYDLAQIGRLLEQLRDLQTDLIVCLTRKLRRSA